MDTCAFLSSFMCSNRTLLIDGRVELKRGRKKQKRHLFLFNDLFVVAQIKCNNNFKMKNKIKLSDMWTASCVSEVEGDNTDSMKSFVLGWPTVNFVATFSFPEQKDEWLSLLQRYIKAEKEKDFPKSIPIKIFTKDIGNCAYSKTITIKNSDTVSEVINMSLSILGITGSVRDYQLWVNSGKEKAPYPLIGHEYPYGIKMSHLRDTALLAELSKDSTSPSSLQEPFLIEELPREMQCQFILKPSHLAETQQLSDSGQKTSRKRSSITNWAIWRCCCAHQDNSPVSPTSPVPGQIFGVSLSSLCENDSLPKPLLEMLCFLNQKGPLTKGIFRVSANVKSCRELKEKLNSGSEVHLDCECVFVIASVLKDFLRNIPGSVFSSDLYDRWICVMDEGSDEEKLNAIQRLLDQLPRANVVLLRYLFRLLHNIEQQSSSNQMTAFNLAVCIAPSLLWPSASSSPELESEFTKKCSQLIQFVIENCHQIFGKEIASLLGEVSVTCDNKENASDVPCIQMSDSSYENEPNAHVDDLDEDDDTLCEEHELNEHDQGSTVMENNDTADDIDEESSSDVPCIQMRESSSENEPNAHVDDLDEDDDTLCEEHDLNEHDQDSTADDIDEESSSDVPCIQMSDSSSENEPNAHVDDLDEDDDTLCEEHELNEHDQDSTADDIDEESSSDVPCIQMSDSSYENEPNAHVDDLDEDDDTLCEEHELNEHDQGSTVMQNNGTADDIDEESSSDVPCIQMSDSSSENEPNAHVDDLDEDGDTLCEEHELNEHDQDSTADDIDEESSSDVPCIQMSDSSYEKEPNAHVDDLDEDGDTLCEEYDLNEQDQGSTFMQNNGTSDDIDEESSPGISSSGFSVSSPQMSEHLVLASVDSSSPVNCTFQEELCSSGLVPEMPAPSSGQASSHLAPPSKDSIECPSHPQTFTWLRNGMAALKNWSLRKKPKAPEEKKIGFLKRRTSPPPHASGVPETRSLQEKQEDMPLRNAKELEALQAAECCRSYPSQDSEKHFSSALKLVEDSLKLCTQSQEEGESSGHCSSETLPCAKTSACSSSELMYPAYTQGPVDGFDVGDKQSTKDI